MLRPAPRKIVIEYDDGSEATSSFDVLPLPLQAEILRQPFASRLEPRAGGGEVRAAGVG